MHVYLLFTSQRTSMFCCKKYSSFVPGEAQTAATFVGDTHGAEPCRSD